MRDGGGETSPLTEDMLRRYLSEMDLFGSEKASSSDQKPVETPWQSPKTRQNGCQTPRFAMF